MVREEGDSTAERGLRVEKMGVGINIVAAAVLGLCAYFLAGLKDEQKNTNTRLEVLAVKVETALQEQAVLKSFDLHRRLSAIELRFAAHEARSEEKGAVR